MILFFGSKKLLFTCNTLQFSFSVIPHQSALRYARPRGSGRRCTPGCPGRVQASLFFHRFTRLPRIFYTSFYADIISSVNPNNITFPIFCMSFLFFWNFLKSSVFLLHNCFYTYIISVATISVVLFRKLFILSDNTFVLTHQTFM